MTTRTGNFPIGFRRGWSDWQKDLDSLIHWAKENGFEAIDLGGDGDVAAEKVRAAGLAIGSVDLPEWASLITADLEAAHAGVARQAEYIARCADQGVRNYFVVMLPADPAKPRAENFRLLEEGLDRLTPTLEQHGGRLVIEGWPGPGALCCTPEGYRAALKRSSPAVGINYDPSHLVRMGIDPIRFVEEFADRVYHVHGKDTEILTEGLYEFGTEQPATFAHGRGFGGHSWRYTIPGQGQVRWTRAFEILRDRGYQGAVSIELEDEHFNGSEAGEKKGLLAGRDFLSAA